MSGGVTSLLPAHCAIAKQDMKTIATFIVCTLFFVRILPASPLEEQNKAIAKHAFKEILSNGNLALAGQFYAADFRSHGVYHDASREENQASLKGWHQAFSNITVEPRKLIAEGDLVTVYWVARGQNTGAANGIPATGKNIVSSGITIWRIVDGKIKDEWAAFDQFEMMQQLGLVASKPK